MTTIYCPAMCKENDNVGNWCIREMIILDEPKNIDNKLFVNENRFKCRFFQNREDIKC